jgi:hypothetical protein
VKQVLSQWQIFAYDRGRKIVQRNLAASRLLTWLDSKQKQIYAQTIFSIRAVCFDLPDFDKRVNKLLRNSKIAFALLHR